MIDEKMDDVEWWGHHLMKNHTAMVGLQIGKRTWT